MVQATRLHRKGLALWVALIAAGIVIVLAVAQLFAYETFSDVLVHNLSLSSASSQVAIITGLIVVAEVVAVAQLLDVPLSRLGRWCSRLAGLFVPVAWMAIMIVKGSGDSSLFGSKIHMPIGVVSYGLMALLLILVLIVMIIDIRRPVLRDAAKNDKIEKLNHRR